MYLIALIRSRLRYTVCGIEYNFGAIFLKKHKQYAAHIGLLNDFGFIFDCNACVNFAAIFEEKVV